MMKRAASIVTSAIGKANPSRGKVCIDLKELQGLETQYHAAKSYREKQLVAMKVGIFGNTNAKDLDKMVFELLASCTTLTPGEQVSLLNVRTSIRKIYIENNNNVYGA